VLLERFAKPFGLFMAIEAASGSFIFSSPLSFSFGSTHPWRIRSRILEEHNIDFPAGAWESDHALRE